MKVILITILLLSAQSVSSQTENKPKKSKPSWGSEMPTREDSPNLSLNTNFDEEDEENNDFGFNREAILDDEADKETSYDIREKELAAKQKLERLKLERQQVEEARALVLQQERIATQKALEEKNKKIAALKTADEENGKIAAQRILEEENKKIAAQKALEERMAALEASERARTAEEQIIKNKATNTKMVAKEVKGGNKLPVTNKEPTKNNYVWKKVKNAAPVYPLKAVRNNQEGWVEVALTINTNGEVVNALVKKTFKNSKIFNRSALKAVNHWRYDPPIKYGVTENLTKVVKIVFQL